MQGLRNAGSSSMGGAELVALTRDRTCERVRTLRGTRRESPTKYRPCLLPSLISTTVSGSRGYLTGSKSSPRTCLATVVYFAMRGWIVRLVYASGGSSGLKVTLTSPCPCVPYHMPRAHRKTDSHVT
jgi:hypothetical protein